MQPFEWSNININSALFYDMQCGVCAFPMCVCLPMVFIMFFITILCFYVFVKQLVLVENTLLAKV